MEVLSLTNYRPAPRYDELPWTQASLEGATTREGEYSLIETLELDPVDADPSAPASRDFTSELVPDDVTWVRIVWLDANGDQQPTLPIPVVSGWRPTTEDVRKRLQLASLTDAQEESALLLIDFAVGIVLEEASREEEWADTLSPTSKASRILKGLAVELVVRGLANPKGLDSLSETLGSYSYREGYRSAAGGSAMALAQHEQLLIRRVVHGANSASAEQSSDVLEAAQCHAVRVHLSE